MSKKIFIFPILIFLVIFGLLIFNFRKTEKIEAQTWLLGWDKRIKLTIDNNDINSNLSNFPILIYLSTSSGRNNDDVSAVFDELQGDANRKKIAVTASDGTTQRYVEIEKWDDFNEQAWLWVKVPSISSTTDTELYLYYDADHADNTDYVGDDPNDAASQAVWDNNFVMVHHLTGASAAALDDSTNNNNDVAGSGGTPAYNSTGKIAKAIDLEKGSSEFVYVNDADTLDGFSTASWEFWFNAESIPADLSSSWRLIMNKYNTSGNQRSYVAALYGGTLSQFRFLLSVNGTGYNVSYYNWEPNLGEWYHITVTWTSGAAPTLYINSTPTAWSSTNSISGTVFPSTQRLDIGNSYTVGRTWDGLLDEIRISGNIARNSSWVKASYETQRDHLLDFGSEETLSIPNNPPTIISISASTDPMEKGTIQTITPSGQADAESDALHIYCCQDTDNTCTPTTTNICNNDQVWSSPYSGMTCTLTALDVSSATTYYARCRIYDGSLYSLTIASTSYTVKQSNGDTCTAGSNCISSNCVDGYCCDSVCTGTCEACNLTGTIGTCTLRSADDNAECSPCNYCDGINTSCQPQTGDTGYLCIDPAYDCVNGTCYVLLAQNVSGWAWSENIGWISLNCYNDYDGDGEKEDHCAGSNYGVDIDEDGLFSGHAWSENIGWISFADFDGDGDIDSDDENIFGSPCAPNCKALFNSETREVSGWARVLAYHGSWDGWIRFDHAQIDEVVYIDSSGDFHGWAWGSDVVGWINFNGVNYKATLDLSGLNQPPSAINLPVDPHNSTDYCEIIGYPPVRVRWEYSDIDDIPEGTDPQSAYEIEVFKVSDGIKVIDTGKKSGETESYVFQIMGERLEWNISYNWQVKVWDNSDEPSDWAISSPFITAVHYYPDTDFSWMPESPAGEELIEFTDETNYYSGGTNWNWNFGDGNISTEQNPTHSYLDTQLRTVTLQACDNIGCCSVGKEITVSFPFPEWEEIAPF